MRSLADALMRVRARRLVAWLRDGAHAAALDLGGRWVDVGSGTGHNAVELRAVGLEVDELDVVDMHMVGPGPSPTEPWPDGARWDGATVLYMLHYPDDRPRLLDRLARQADAVLIVQSTYAGRLGLVALTLRDLASGDLAHRAAQLARVVPRGRASMSSPRHLHLEELRALVRGAGLDVIHHDRRAWAFGVTRNLLVAVPAPKRPTPLGPAMSVIVPARDEARGIGGPLRAIARAARAFSARFARGVELLVVDDASSDDLEGAVRAALSPHETPALSARIVPSRRRGAAGARNTGAGEAHGEVLVFVDADTWVPEDALERFYLHATHHARWVGLTGFDPADGGRRARIWWAFWEAVRRLPIAKAKAMPACMFVTRDAFDRYGPFDERVAIGEEWPVLARVYAEAPERFIYDRSIRVRTSSRRMEKRPFGYTRTFAHWALAVLTERARNGYADVR